MRALTSPVQDRDLLAVAGVEALHLHHLDVDAAKRQIARWAAEAHEIAAEEAEARARVHEEALAPLAARRLLGAVDVARLAWLLDQLDRCHAGQRGLSGPVEICADPAKLRRHAADLQARAERLVARAGYRDAFLPKGDEYAGAARDLGRAYRAIRAHVQQARNDATTAKVAIGRLLASRAGIREPDRLAEAEAAQTRAVAKLAALDQLLAHLAPLPVEG
jgi:hypothetical protein